MVADVPKRATMRYEEAVPDMSGSRTKSRMRVEVLWGLDLLIERMRRDEDFAVVFDYLCDVELHLGDAIEFHQVKTKARKHFDFYWLCGAEPGKDSVMVTLYRLKEVEEPGKCTRLFLVANRPLSIGGEQVAPEPGVFEFDGFPDGPKGRIVEAIAERLGIEAADVDLRNIGYRYEELALGEGAKDRVLGKLVRVYKETRGEECNRPGALFKALSDLASDRASEEHRKAGLDEVISSKGITRVEMERMFDRHGERSNNVVERALRWVEGLPPTQQRGLKGAVSEVVKIRSRSPLWGDVIDFVREALGRESCAGMDETQLVELVARECPQLFNVEMTDALKRAWASLALFQCLEEW